MTYGIWEAFSSFQPVTHSLRSAETSYSKALWDEMFAYLHSMIWYRGSKVLEDQSHTTDFFFIIILQSLPEGHILLKYFKSDTFQAKKFQVLNIFSHTLGKLGLPHKQPFEMAINKAMLM